MLIDRDIEDIIDDDGGGDGTIHCYYLTLRSWLAKRVFINNVFNGYLYTALFHFEEDKKNIQSPTSHRAHPAQSSVRKAISIPSHFQKRCLG